jgi:CheY-like chemotaxis protein
MSARSLLIVEDEPSLNRAIATLLRSLNWKTQLFLSAEEAWESQRSWSKCSGAILDVTLPGQSGWSFYQELRHQFPHLPIIITSGHAAWQLQEEGPFTLYLPKPFGLEELQSALCGLGLET